VNVITKYLSAYGKDVIGSKPACSREELNRDIALWFCRSLQPFEEVESVGFHEFFVKNFNSVELPCSSTLSGTALLDIYLATKKMVKEELRGVTAASILFDG
jgi:hypothetical protein